MLSSWPLLPLVGGHKPESQWNTWRNQSSSPSYTVLVEWWPGIPLSAVSVRRWLRTESPPALQLPDSCQAGDDF